MAMDIQSAFKVFDKQGTTAGTGFDATPLFSGEFESLGHGIVIINSWVDGADGTPLTALIEMELKDSGGNWNLVESHTGGAFEIQQLTTTGVSKQARSFQYGGLADMHFRIPAGLIRFKVTTTGNADGDSALILYFQTW